MGQKYSERKQNRSLFWWWRTNQKENLSEAGLDSLTKESLNDVELKLILAREYYYADSFENAIRYAEEVQSENKTDFYSTKILFESYYAKRDLKKALNFATRLIQINNDESNKKQYEFPCNIEINEFTIQNVIGCYYGLKDIAGMKTFLNSYCSQYVRDFYIEFNEIVEADTVKSLFRIEFFKVMLLYQIRKEGLIREIAEYYEELNKIDSAIAYYNILVNYDEQTRSNRAKLYFKKGQYSKAIDDYTIHYRSRCPFNSMDCTLL